MRISKLTTRKFNFESDPDEGWIKIRELSPGERTDIIDEVFSQEIEYRGDGSPVFKQKTDKKMDREKTFQARIVEWGNMFAKDGSPLPCTHENIVLAMREIPGFAEAVNGFFRRLDEDLADERKGQEKNLSSTQPEP